MERELVLLYVKEKKYDEAIDKYLQKGEYVKAEEFCQQHSSQDGLMTTLLGKYFDMY